MDISKMRVLLQGAVKIFEAGLKSKTWVIHGLPNLSPQHIARDAICAKHMVCML